MALAAHRDQNLTGIQKNDVLEAYGKSLRGTGTDHEDREKLTEGQKRAILRGWNAAKRGECVDARTMLEEIRQRHGF